MHKYVYIMCIYVYACVYTYFVYIYYVYICIYTFERKIIVLKF